MFWNIVIAIASFILNLVLAPKPQNAKPASLEDFSVPTAEEGIEIPVVFGTVHIKNPNVVWYGDFKTKSIKGGPRRYGFFGPRAVTGHKYFLGMHMLLCHGVYDEIRQMWAGDKQFFPGEDEEPISGTTTYQVNASGLFGGKEKEGGLEGTIAILGGTPGQGQNAYLVDKLDEPNLPAFRGVVSVIWEKIYIGTSTYLKPWEFVLKRIHKTSAGVTQWYDDKAAVPDTPPSSAAGLGLGSATLIPFNTVNGEFERSVRGGYIAIVTDYGVPGGAGDHGAEPGLNVWRVSDMHHEVIAPPSSDTGLYGIGGVAYITRYDEIMTREGGNASASADTSICFRRLSDINTVVQAINAGTICHAHGNLDLNFGMVCAEYEDYLVVKLGPDIYETTPWVLMHRSGGSWDVVETHTGLSAAAGGLSNMAISQMTMGPEYIYAVIWADNLTSKVVRVKWAPLGSWEEEVIDLSPFINDASPRTPYRITYWAPSNEVIFMDGSVTSGQKMYVMNATLTAVNRWRGKVDDDSTGFNTVTSGRMIWSDTSILATGVWGPHYILHIYEIRVSDLEVVRDIVMADTTYTHKDVAAGVSGGLMLYDEETGGVIVEGHLTGLSEWWPIPRYEALDMNPAHIIRECLTDKIWGMGYNAADIDDDAFSAAADALYDECFGLSLQWNREEKIEEFITVILSHIDAYLYLRRTTGRFYLKLIRNDYVLGSLPVFDEDDVVQWDEVARREPAEAVNSVIVKYTNRRGGAGMGRGKDASHSFDNIGQIQQLGERISATRVYPGISRGNLASRVAARDQMSLGIGLISGRVTGKRTLDILYPGDPFRLVSSRHNLDGEVMRVVSLKFGDGRDNKISLQFAQDVFRLGAPDLIDTSEGDWENPSNPPSAVYPRLVWEAPYWHLHELVGAANAGAILTTDLDAGMLAIAGGQPTPDATHAEIWVNGIEEELLDFAPAGTLSLAIAAFNTAISLDNAVDEDLIEAGQLVAIGGTEIVRVTAVSGVDLTVSRGLVDTIPQPHAAGTSVVVFDGFSMSDFNARNAATTPAVKLLTTTSQGTLNFSVAPVDAVDMDSRAIRPLRPANVKVEGFASGPVDVTGLSEFTVTWANRNRLTEISTVLAWNGATVTPEAGQTTVIEVLDPTGTTVLTTHAGLTGTSFDVPAASFAGNTSGFIRVGAERDGYREWQAYAIECAIPTPISVSVTGLSATAEVGIVTVDTGAVADPYWSSIVLLIGADGADGSTSILDESGYARTLTLFGSAQIDTAQSKFGGSSLIFDGTTDAVQAADSADFELGTGQFTIECFIRAANVSGSRVIIWKWGAAGTQSFAFWVSSGALAWNVSTTGSDSLGDINIAGAISANTWYHVCVDYDGTKYRMYKDGVMIGSSTTARNIFNSTATLSIGAQSNNQANCWNGWIDEVRITKGIARYASDGGYTVPTEAFPRSGPAATDPYFASVVLLVGADGTDASTTILDESGYARTLTLFGSAQIDTAQSKFGGSSLLVDADGWHVTAADSADWAFGAGAFTIEAWVRLAVADTNVAIVSQWGGTSSFAFYQDAGNLWFRAYDTGGTLRDSANYTWSTTTGTWYHVAVDRDGSGNLRVYVNGAMVSKTTGYTHNIRDGSGTLDVGAVAGFLQYNFDGWFDEVRITKGVARYASDSGYTVPTAAFPRTGPVPTDPYWSNVVLLVGANGADGSTTIIDESGAPHTLTANSGAQIDTAQSKFGGSSLLMTGGTSANVSAADSADWNFGAGQFTIECWVRFDQLAPWQTIISQWATPSDQGWIFDFPTSAANVLRFLYSTAGSDTPGTQGAWVPTTGVWYHVAADRDASNNLRIYADGVMLAKITAAATIFNSTSTLRIGSVANTTSPFYGWIDELRITKGVARYASDSGYTVPTAAFPRA